MAEILDLAQKLSGTTLAGLLLFILYGSYKGIWVWGSQLQESKAETREWKSVALQGAGLAEKLIPIAKRGVE